MKSNYIALIVMWLGSSFAVKINFSNCHSPGWICLNNSPIDITYSCPVSRNNDYVLHLKDFYSNQVSSLTVQNCKVLTIVTDCPFLQRDSQLKRFIVRNVEKLEFTTFTSGSLVQTPPEVLLENVIEIVSLPSKIFKSPSSNSERKCLGASSMNKIRITNSNINLIQTQAIHNVTDIKSIEFENITITTVQTLGIAAVMNADNTVFKIINTKIDNIENRALTVHSATVTISESNFGDIIANSINITADYLQIIGNTFRQINPYGLTVKSVNTDIRRNDIATLKSNALSNVRCMRKRTSKKQFNFCQNRVEHVEPYSLIFDYTSCKIAGTSVVFNDNKIDCRCQNIAFLNSATANVELNSMILDVSFNNTCLSAPCLLPLDIVKLLLESDMCQLDLDPQVMCLLYNDRHANNEVTTDEEVTEPAPLLYLIRTADSSNGVASMTAINKDDLLRDSQLNISNRTAIKVVFDSSRDFVETLRSASSSRIKPVEQSKPPANDEYVNRCVGPQCRNVAYDRQKALDFYKYVYAQLRQPRQNDNEETKT